MNTKKHISKAKKFITDTLLHKLYPRHRSHYHKQDMIHLIDVGSIGGLPQPWSSNTHRIGFLLNFEPNEEPKRGSNFMTYNTALWESEATLPFYIYKGLNGTGSSLFKQNFDYVSKNFEVLKKHGPSSLAETWFDRSELVETKQIKCRPIDDILKEEFPNTPFHFMKIDAQGAEYNILKGAKSLLANSCIGLHLELFVVPMYEGIMLLDEVAAFLADFGFHMVKKFPPHGTFDSQHDCVFLNEKKDVNIKSVIRQIYASR